MLNFRIKFSTFVTVLILLGNALAHAGERESHGGNFSGRAQFISMRTQILNSWTAKTTKWLGVTKDEFELKTAEVEIIDVPKCLDSDGNPNGNAAQNFEPSPEHLHGLIEIGEDKWPEYEKSLVKRYFLVLHEYLSFVDKERAYQLTKEKLHNVTVVMEGRGLSTDAIAQLLLEQLLIDFSRAEDVVLQLVSLRCPKNAKGEVINRYIQNCQIKVALQQRNEITNVEELQVAKAGEGWMVKFDFKLSGQSSSIMATLGLPTVRRVEELVEPALGQESATILEIPTFVQIQAKSALKWFIEKAREQMSHAGFLESGIGR